MTSKTTQRQEKRADVCSLSCRVLYYEIMGAGCFRKRLRYPAGHALRRQLCRSGQIIRRIFLPVRLPTGMNCFASEHVMIWFLQCMYGFYEIP